MSLLFKGREQGAKVSRISLWQRVQMFVVTHFRQAINSLGELWRSPVATLMTVGVLGLSITLPSTLYLLVKNTEKLSAGWEQASEISLFLKPALSENRIDQLVTRLTLWPEIDSVVFVPSDAALEEFKQLSGFGEALSYLDKNPLPDVLLVVPTSKHASPSAAAVLLEKLNNEREVDIGRLDIEWLERLHALLDVAKNLVNIVAILLFLAVVLIVGNTIRLNIVSKHDEILVMKLVGATDSFIHRPFLYVGFWYGLMGGLLAWIAVSILLAWISISIHTVAEIYVQEFSLSGFDASALITMLGVSIGLGLAGSAISVNRYVREIEPR